MTTAGLGGVGSRDAGAAPGVVNTAHQLGSALGLGILTAVGTAAVVCNGRPGLVAHAAAVVAAAVFGDKVSGLARF